MMLRLLIVFVCTVCLIFIPWFLNLVLSKVFVRHGYLRDLMMNKDSVIARWLFGLLALLFIVGVLFALSSLIFWVATGTVLFSEFYK